MICERCGHEFTPKLRGRARFCPDCRQAHKREKSREFYWANLETERARSIWKYWRTRDAALELAWRSRAHKKEDESC